MPPQPQAALPDQDVIMEVGSDAAPASDAQSRASGGSSMRPGGYDPGRWTNQQYKQQRIAHRNRLPFHADQSKQRRTAESFDKHGKDWVAKREHRLLWSARGCDRNTRRFLTFPPWLIVVCVLVRLVTRVFT